MKKVFAMLLVGSCVSAVLAGTLTQFSITGFSYSALTGTQVDIVLAIGQPYPGNPQGSRIRAKAYHAGTFPEIYRPLLGLETLANVHTTHFTGANGLIPNEYYYNLQARGEYKNGSGITIVDPWLPSYNEQTIVPAFVTQPADLTAAPSPEATSNNSSFTVNWVDSANPSWTKYEVEYVLQGQSPVIVRPATDAGGTVVVKGTNIGVSTNLSATVRNLPSNTRITSIIVRAISYAIDAGINLPSDRKPDGNDHVITLPPNFGTTNLGPTISDVTILFNSNSTVATLTPVQTGNPAGAVTYVWSRVSVPAGAPDVTPTPGTGPTTNVTFFRAGSYVIRVVGTDTQGNADTFDKTVPVPQVAGSFTITPANPRIAFGGNTDFDLTNGLDQFNQTYSNPPVTWSVLPALSDGDTLNTTSGLFNAGASGAARQYTVTATANTGSANASTTLRVGTGPTITNITVNLNAGQTQGTATATVGGTPTAPVTLSWTTVTQPASGNLRFDGNATGTANPTALTFQRAGDYTIRLTATDGDGVSATLDKSFSVQALPNTIAVNPSGTVKVPFGTSRNFAATLTDQFSQTINNPTISWLLNPAVASGDTFTPSAASADFVASNSGAARQYTLTASSGSATTNVTIRVGFGPAVTAINFSNATDTGVTATAVIGGSPTGNVNVAWSITNSPSGAPPVGLTTNTSNPMVALFGKTGTYTFHVVATDGDGETSSLDQDYTVDLIAQTITISPQTPRIAFNSTVDFDAVVIDQFNQTRNDATIVWSVTPGLTNGDSINPTSGVFSSGSGPTTRNYSVTAMVGLRNNSTTLQVAGYAPVPVCTVGTPTETTETVSVVASDQDPGDTEGTLSYQWTILESPGGARVDSVPQDVRNKGLDLTLHASGLHRLRATATDLAGLSGTCEASFTVLPVIKRVVVSPENASVKRLGSQQFQAFAKDQFDNNTNSTFAWDVNGGGSVPAGLFTGTAIGDRFRITATTPGNIIGTAFVSVVDFSVNNAIAYPVPWKATEDTNVTFQCIGTSGKIRIYNASGREVKQITYNDTTTLSPECIGVTTWPVTNSDNERVASGVYIYVIESPEAKKKGKLIIIQ